MRAMMERALDARPGNNAVAAGQTRADDFFHHASSGDMKGVLEGGVKHAHGMVFRHEKDAPFA